MSRAVIGRELFGHPRGLTVLATTEMWERFSFYGMQALLMLYMTKYLLLPQHAANVLGLAAFRGGVESMTGPLSDLAFAAQTYGLYSGLIYLTPLIGAWLGDRVLGRTRAFGIYLITLNIGALTAPLVIGTLGEDVSWHLGFGAAGVGMLLALATYLAGRNYLPPDTLVKGAAKVKRAPLTRAEWRRMGVILLLLYGPYMLYSAASNQSYSLMYIWADTHVDRMVLGFEVPVTWIGIFDGLATIAGVWLGNRLSVWLIKRRGHDLGDVTKIGIGMAGIVLAWLFAAAISGFVVTPVLLWMAFYVIQDFSYGAFIEPSVPSVTSRDSPPSVTSLMMALYKAAVAVSYFLSGWMGRFFEPLGAQRFWLLNGALAAVAAAMMILGHKAWVRGLGRAEQHIDA
jgi:POT family proton-dependent oligopeptide transporter